MTHLYSRAMNYVIPLSPLLKLWEREEIISADCEGNDMIQAPLLLLCHFTSSCNFQVLIHLKWGRAFHLSSAYTPLHIPHPMNCILFPPSILPKVKQVLAMSSHQHSLIMAVIKTAISQGCCPYLRI